MGVKRHHQMKDHEHKPVWNAEYGAYEEWICGWCSTNEVLSMVCYECLEDHNESHSPEIKEQVRKHEEWWSHPSAGL